jgi:dTDP-4-dehydrorhamnose reductase
MRILVTGASGQLGCELLPLLEGLGDITGVDREVRDGAADVLRQDLGEFAAVESLLDRTRPDVIINAAAYTAVDRAEDEPDTAFRINADLPGCLAGWSKRNDALLLHYSTDYVFPGDGDRPYREDDPTGPLNVYGDSKLAGEVAVAASGCHHFVLRTSWVWSGQGNNFLLTMLRLAAERPSLSIVNDQVGCPTWARNLARVSRQLLEQVPRPSEDRPWGVYHYCDAGVVSWFGFAKAIFGAAVEAGLMDDTPALSPVNSTEFPQKAKRPAFSVLDTCRIRDRFDIVPVSLEKSLSSCLQELSNVRK